MTPVEPGLEKVCRLVEARSGLRLDPPDRADNRLRLERARRDAGCVDWAALGARLEQEPLTGPAWAAAIRALTVGETYFFRHRPQFDLLREEILPPLIAQRRRDPHPWLRLWSAGCASGEEAYSLAILLHDLIPDAADWAITILATDLNAEALARARTASYGRWSFREVERTVIDRYFHAVGDRLTVAPEVRNAVTFSALNLVEDTYPRGALAHMDVILCRNVTMYFPRATAAEVARRLLQTLNPGGWLLVGPSEPDPSVFGGFECMTNTGTSAYRRPAVEPAVALPSLVTGEPRLAAAPSGWGVPPLPAAPTAEECLRAARAAGDSGAYQEALAWAQRALETDSTNADAHYLLGTFHAERQDSDLAVAAFRRAIYLDPQFALAQYALGHALQVLRRRGAAERALRAARRMLEKLPGSATLRGSRDLEAAELRAIVERELQKVA